MQTSRARLARPQGRRRSRSQGDQEVCRGTACPGSDTSPLGKVPVSQRQHTGGVTSYVGFEGMGEEHQRCWEPLALSILCLQKLAGKATSRTG